MIAYHSLGWMNLFRRSDATLWPLLLVCGFLLGCDSHEPSAAEINAIATIQNQGGQVTVRQSGYVRVDFTQMGVDDAGLVPLKHLTRLETLVLAGTDITDTGMQHLAGATSLQQLSLKGTQISDTGLTGLSGLTGLRELDLEQTKITDAGLTHLHGLTGLEKLYLDGTAVTSAGLRELNNTHPRLKVFGPN